MREQSDPVGKVPPSPSRLKRIADTLRLATPSLTNLAALDVVAQQKGWPSYKSYQREWKNSRTRPLSTALHQFELTLKAHWRDRQTSSSGTEIVHMSLSEPWWSFLTLEQRRSVTAVSRFRINGSDRSTLVSSTPFESSTGALQNAEKAARALAFIDVLRVLPASMRAASDGLGINFATWRHPAMDHELIWLDPESGTCFLTNEPYHDALMRKSDLQQEWLASRGFSVVTVPSHSIHYHPITTLQFISKTSNKQVIERLRERCHRLQEAFATITTIS